MRIDNKGELQHHLILDYYSYNHYQYVICRTFTIRENNGQTSLNICKSIS